MLRKRIVTVTETKALTSVTVSVICGESRSFQDAFREGIPRDGAGAAPRARPYTALPGGLGIMPAGITTGARGASLDWDRAGG